MIPADTPLRIAFAGAGRRMRGVYLPLVRALAPRFEPVGFISRDPDRGASASSELGLPYYRDMATLAREAKPDLIALCVPPQANVPLAREAMALKLPVLMETPISLRLSEARALVRQCNRVGAIIGVAEQKPYLPVEQFKRLLVANGALGRVRLAQNDYRSYDYHSIAQLRAYLPDRGVRCLRVRCLSSFSRTYVSAGRGGADPRPRPERWDIATVEMADGSILIHNFSDSFKASPIRIRPVQRIFGETGSIVDEEIASVGPGGEVFQGSILAERDGPGAAPRKLTARLPGGTVAWENPVPEAGLAEDQVGLACHFLSMRASIREGRPPLYPLSEAIIDLEIMAALRFSARVGGIPVGLPFGAGKMLRIVATHPSLWGKGVSFALAKARRSGAGNRA